MNDALPPLVSVIMPIRNEAGFIHVILDQLLSQDYPPECVEIIVADGMSDDGTRAILGEYQQREPRVRMIDNPQRVTPCALNTAVRAAAGEIVCVLHGHCEIPTDYLRQIVRLTQEHPEAWVVGGPIVHAGRRPFGQAVAIAMAHPCGVGMARFRFPDFEGYAEAVQFPAYRKWVFDKVGEYDERLVRTEDDEISFRIVQAGGKIFLSPAVRFVYYVRERIGQLFWQYFQYSFWRIPVLKKHKRPTTVRQLIPTLFFATMIGLAVLGVWLRSPLAALAMPLAYMAILVGVGLSVLPRKGIAVAARLPVALATMHVAYALGLFCGFCALVVHPRAWDLEGSMSALTR